MKWWHYVGLKKMVLYDVELLLSIGTGPSLMCASGDGSSDN